MQNFQGWTEDSQSGLNIGEVAIYGTNASGGITSLIGYVRDDGYFDLPMPSGKVQFSYPGYNKVIVDPQTHGYNAVKMEPLSSSVGEEVVLTSKIKKPQSGKSNYTLPIALGSAAVVAFVVYLAIR